jgi:hypothetical protein
VKNTGQVVAHLFKTLDERQFDKSSVKEDNMPHTEQKVFLTEEGYPHISLSAVGVFVNEKTQRVLKWHPSAKGFIQLWKDGKCKSVHARKLLAKYFYNPLTIRPAAEIRHLAFLGLSNYTITSDGKVWNNEMCWWLNPMIDESGYVRISVSTDLGAHTYYRVHRLVAMAFIPNFENHPEVNHVNGNKQDNSVINLDWVSHAENVEHARRNSLVPGSLTKDEVVHVCELLEAGYSSDTVRKVTGYSPVSIYRIARGKSYTEISAKYNVSNRTKNRSIDDLDSFSSDAV